MANAQLAGWGPRVGAAVIDFLIRMLVFGVLVGLVVLVGLSGSDVALGLGIAIGLLLFLVVSILYSAVFMARAGKRNGQTPGHQVLGIRVARDTGEPLGVGYGLLREVAVKALLFELVGGSILYIPTIVNYLWPLWDDENRALHDMLVSTHVVRA